ncbi:MAG: DegT/DnrJ/EryC1/StrS family aminotransferase [Euryarchaeota archaeon]|nr:DegT/DnrJ/EryC1/StrS family aminotransferase [Euryarchaeota archaeon]
MQIPWAIPNFQKEDKNALLRVIKSNWLSMGNEVKKFEERLSSYLRIKYSIAVNNGTAALDIALKCIGIKNGDEVIIPALTYIATGNAVLYNQGTPVFVDIDDTLNIDTSLIEEKITDKTKAIMNIDLGGNASNYNKLLEIAKRYDIPLVVDGAQSFGSEYYNVKCCSHGLINTTSFHAAKILTTVEGGMIFTNDKKMNMLARTIRNQGDVAKFDHQFLGNNYRMIDLLAAMGNSQMNRFEGTLRKRRKKVDYYRDYLKNVEYPRQLENTINSNFFFLILTKNRDRLNHHLNENGIDTRITYPLPINEQPLFRKYGKEVFPMAKKISERVISLPLHQSLTRTEQDYIIKKINKFKE